MLSVASAVFCFFALWLKIKFSHVFLVCCKLCDYVIRTYLSTVIIVYDNQILFQQSIFQPLQLQTFSLEKYKVPI